MEANAYPSSSFTHQPMHSMSSSESSISYQQMSSSTCRSDSEQIHVATTSSHVAEPMLTRGHQGEQSTCSELDQIDVSFILIFDIL